MNTPGSILALKHIRVTRRLTYGGIRFTGWTLHPRGTLKYCMDTGILTQEPTVDQVWSRAVRAERGDRVRNVTRRTSFKSTGADVSYRDTGAIFTLELEVRVAGGGDGGREKGKKEHGGVAEGRLQLHPEGKVETSLRQNFSYLWPLASV